MQKLSLVLLLHNHQPVGNFDHVIEHAYQRAYKPFFDTLSSFRHKICLHLSGPLFDWLTVRHPEYIDAVAARVAAGNIEIIGGGYYEPVLAAIPFADGAAQLRLFSQALERRFGGAVNGAWLTERVWEPHLPAVLHDGGIRYLCVDDYHFLRSGITSAELDGYYLTEHENKRVAVYPGSETLRYIMPFRTVEDVGAYLSHVHKSGVDTLIFADDGEKFGIWPETHQWVYGEKWLEKFFRFLEDNNDWIETVTLHEHISRHRSRGACYLPTTSYPELGEWALPAAASARYKKYFDIFRQSPDFNEIKPFFQGGQWKNFLAKYRESQIMHKKMIFISELIRDRDVSEKKELFAAQCNDAYWHGVFGGLYLPHLRREIHSLLVKAERRIFKEPAVKYYDFDLDGRDEIFAITSRLAAIFDPDDGGTLVSFDFLPKNIMLTDTLTRRREAYHLKLAETTSHTGTVTIHDQFRLKEAGLERFLVYDEQYRASMRTYFFNDVSLEALRNAATGESHPVASADYSAECTIDQGIFRGLFSAGGEGWKCEKNCVMTADELTVGVRAQAEGGERYAGLEWNFNLFAPDAPDRFILVNNTLKLPLNALRRIEHVEKITLCDEWTGIAIEMSLKGFDSLCLYPVETVSLSESGVERTFQGSCLVLLGTIENGGFTGSCTVTVKTLE